MGKTYTKLDDNNVALVETQEVRNILNKDTLIAQKAEITKAFNDRVAIIDEALAEFTEE